MLALSILSVAVSAGSLVLLLWLVVRRPAAADDGAVRRLIAEESARSREEARAAASALRQEVTALFATLATSSQSAADVSAQTQRERFDHFAAEMRRLIADSTSASTSARQALETMLLAQYDKGHSEAAENRRAHREEIARRLDAFNETLVAAVTAHGTTQRQDLEAMRAQVEKLAESNELRMIDIRRSVDTRLQEIAASNARELQEMRATVDEKLEGTLTQRIGESFALVTQRLEEVHRGLGEMRTLANGVGDLKKVFSNVKSRGGWGEVQLESLLEQMLSSEQFERNVVTKEGSREAVEFAVKFPGKGDLPLLLPLDAKFPVEDYQQLIDAHEIGDGEAVEAAARRLETSVRNSAKTIREKYIHPPVTTDFAIMFLPTEGLYAEVLRRPGLAEQIQREQGVLIAGPTTLTAILSSLQMGFRTLAIEKRSSEVWRLLEAVKTEFGKFEDVIKKTIRNLDSARNQIDQLGVRTRAVNRKLRDVQALPEPDAKLLLNLSTPNVEADDDEDAWVEPTAETQVRLDRTQP
ncbi:MAG TPA: DNA recombination protein RmuC [Thermoanaerobaculia bacterium]|nr:DNA recombination protein RmuC [Thermoanaerobaculia bacterium]